MDRKQFLAALPLLGLGGFARATSQHLPLDTSSRLPVGLQLYSLQDQLKASPGNVRILLEGLSAIGVKELETASGEHGLYYGYPPGELARMINDLGMRWVGNHIGGIPRREDLYTEKANRPNLRDNLMSVLSELAEGGCEWVVCAGSAIATLDEIEATAALFSLVAKEAGKMEMKFAYHNHKREFEKVSGITAFDYIMANTPADKVYMQLDLGWAVMAGKDPVELFRQHPQRFPLWHIKDFSAATKKPCRIGEGIVDFKRIFRYAQLSGVRHAFVEQDDAGSVKVLADGIKWLKTEVKTNRWKRSS